MIISKPEDMLSPPTTLVFFSFLFPLLFFFFFFFTHRVRPSSKLPPSPPRLPIVGNLRQLGSQPHRSLGALADKHGPLMFLKLGSIPTIVVSSEEMAREVTKAQDHNFAFRPSAAFSKKISYDCTDVAFAPYGEYWRQVRKITALHLLSAKKVQSFRRVREEEVALMVERINRECSCSSNDGGGGVVNLSKMLVSMTNDIVSRASLGKKLYGEEGNNGTRFGELMTECGALVRAIHVGDFFPRFGWLSKLSGLEARMKRHAKDWDDFLNEVIDDHLLHRSGSEEAHQTEDLLDVLLSLCHDESLTMDNVKALLLDMLTAGIDSSYIVIEWTIAELIRNPLVMKKVQEEIRRILVGKTAIEEEDISKMFYLKAVIKEALRLHPPTPIILREAAETTHINGYEIPRSTRVMINVWAICQASESWDSPEKFLPERFLDSSVDFKGNDFHYIIFGAGRRICPGISFSISIIELALANLLHYFDWSLPYGKNHEDLDMAETYGVTMGMKYNLVLVPTQYASTQSF